MVLERLFGGKKIKFRCEFKECKSYCCKNSLVVLNEEDIQRFTNEGINVDEITTPIELNQFLKTFGAPAMSSLDGLKVLSVKKDTGGSCVFLDVDTGYCKIYAVRPYLCREFPFIISKSKIIKQEPSCTGLGKEDEMSFDELVEYIGIKGMERKPPYIVGEKSKTEMLAKVIGLLLKVKG